MKERQTKILETIKNRIFCQKFTPPPGRRAIYQFLSLTQRLLPQIETKAPYANFQTEPERV